MFYCVSWLFYYFVCNNYLSNQPSIIMLTFLKMPQYIRADFFAPAVDMLYYISIYREVPNEMMMFSHESLRKSRKSRDAGGQINFSLKSLGPKIFGVCRSDHWNCEFSKLTVVFLHQIFWFQWLSLSLKKKTNKIKY